MRGKGRYILLTVIAAVLAVFLLWPILMTVRGAFVNRGQFTFAWLRLTLEDPSIRQWLINAAKVAVCTTALTALLAVPLAVLADKVNFRGKAYASALLMIPMILPPFVGAVGFLKLFARDWGSINLIFAHLGLPKVDLIGQGKFWAVVVLEALHLYPILYLNAVAALANIDPAMSDAARNLGASRWRVFWRITLPLMRPGLFAGCTIVFIWSFCELGTPLMLGYESILPVKIYDGLRDLDPRTSTFALVFVLLASSVSLYAVGRLLFGQRGSAMEGRAVVGAAFRKASWPATLGCWAAFGVITLLASLPHIGVVLMSVTDTWEDTILPVSYTAEHLLGVFRNETTWNSILNSLRYASMSTVLCAAMGLSIAYLIVRLRVKGSGMLDAVSMLPLAVPGLVMASGYVAMTRSGAALDFMNPARNPTAILVIAYTVRRIPYMVRSISAGLEQTSISLEEAAQNLGAGRARAIWRITVPLVMSNILAGSILAFSFNMLEVSDSLILAQDEQFFPITKQLFQLSGLGSTRNEAAALGVFGMILLAGTLLLSNVLLGKKMGQLFRV